MDQAMANRVLGPTITVGGLKGEVTGERTIIETMSITSQRLEDIEQKVNILYHWLFGPQLQRDECKDQPDFGYVRSLADHAFGLTVDIERKLVEIRDRLAE